jgi:hypothetical protein
MDNLIWSVNGQRLLFEDWLIKNSNELNCIMAESGADRELDYDYEDECEGIYDEYHIRRTIEKYIYS